MIFSNIFSLISLFIAATSAAPIVLRKRDWDYGDEKVHGVNLGGWLVLEPYITPSLFESFDSPPADEYHYTQQLGKTEASKRLQEHWSNWITEQDFKYIANLGLNAVRIPIGYWAFELLDNDPYVQGQEQYLDKAIGWARDNNLKVWVDLHGAPGSQNGFDNSGLRDEIGFQNGNNVDVTLDVLKKISAKYTGSKYNDVVIGIELLNEPLGPSLNLDELKDFYNKGYDIVRDQDASMPVIIQDAFESDNYWDSTLNTELDSSKYSVIVDHHHYQVFSTGELQRDLNQHVQTACSWGKAESNEYHWNIVGEWSAALTDCAKWLNGANRGARYDATYQNTNSLGSCDNLYTYDADYWKNDDVIKEYRQYVEAQMDAYEHGKVGGWYFWCWKTEGAVEWDFQRLAGLNIIPQPLSDRWYPNQCGF